MLTRSFSEPRPQGGRLLLVAVALTVAGLALSFQTASPAGACEPPEQYPPSEWPQCTTTTTTEPEPTTTTTTAVETTTTTEAEVTTTTTAPASSTTTPGPAPDPAPEPGPGDELPRTGPADWVLVLAVVGSCLLGMGLLRGRTDRKAEA